MGKARKSSSGASDLVVLVECVEHNWAAQTAYFPPDGYAKAARRLEKAGLLVRGTGRWCYIPSASGFRLVEQLIALLQHETSGRLR